MLHRRTCVRRFFVGIPLQCFLRKMSTKCQHFTGLVRFTVFYVGSKSNMKPTKCQQTPNKCQHFVNIVSWHLFLREEPSISSWLPQNVSASKACQKQFKNQNAVFYQINLDFSNRTEKTIRWYSQLYDMLYMYNMPPGFLALQPNLKPHKSACRHPSSLSVLYTRSWLPCQHHAATSTAEGAPNRQ